MFLVRVCFFLFPIPCGVVLPHVVKETKKEEAKEKSGRVSFLRGRRQRASFFCALCFFSLFSSLVCSLTFPLGEWSSLERTRGDKAREGTRARERERVLSWWPSRKKISLSPYIYVFFLFLRLFFLLACLHFCTRVCSNFTLFFKKSCVARERRRRRRMWGS